MRFGLWILTILVEIGAFFWLSSTCGDNWKITIAIMLVAIMNYIQGIERGRG